MRTVEQEFLTVAEVASILKLNQATVRSWIDAGKPPALHIGERVRVRRADFGALLDASVIALAVNEHEDEGRRLASRPR
jgi:excisionase family DNA binding protein